MSSSETRTYLAKVARLYYLEEMSQPEIARRMNVSVATISRALRKARESEIVRISIDESFERMGELELALEKEWGLQECVVVPTYERTESTYLEMAHVLSEILARLLSRGSTIGVSWGETLKAIGEHLRAIPGRDVRVIPIIGAMGMVDTGIYPNSIAREFASRLDGTPYLVNIPAVVDDRGIATRCSATATTARCARSGRTWISRYWE
jgi:DNA-binding transcriptional regulator LsrR (DeoR family)